MRRHQNDRLRQIHQHIGRIVTDILDVLVLIGDDQRHLVGIEVGNARIDDVQPVDQVELRNAARVLNQVRIERRKQEAQQQNRAADRPVRLLKQAHQPLDRLRIPLRQRPVQAERDGGPDAQLHQREHRQDVGKQPGQSQIGGGHAPREEDAQYQA